MSLDSIPRIGTGMHYVETSLGLIYFQLEPLRFPVQSLKLLRELQPMWTANVQESVGGDTKWLKLYCTKENVPFVTEYKIWASTY